jgi:hypothetical protein
MVSSTRYGKHCLYLLIVLIDNRISTTLAMEVFTLNLLEIGPSRARLQMVLLQPYAILTTGVRLVVLAWPWIRLLRLSPPRSQLICVWMCLEEVPDQLDSLTKDSGG